MKKADALLAWAGFMVKFEGPDDLYLRMVRQVPMWKEIVERADLTKN